MNVFALLIVVILGLLFGSFLNVCISRLPAHDSIVTPRSRCPHCGTQIRAWDNIPVLSWILLNRRCRDCQAIIPIRYPLVEIALPCLWVPCFLKSGPVLESLQSAILFLASATFCFFVLGLAVMDLETMRLPNSFTRPGTAIAIAFAAIRLAGVDGRNSPSPSVQSGPNSGGSPSFDPSSPGDARGTAHSRFCAFGGKSHLANSLGLSRSSKAGRDWIGRCEADGDDCCVAGACQCAACIFSCRCGSGFLFNLHAYSQADIWGQGSFFQ